MADTFKSRQLIVSCKNLSQYFANIFVKARKYMYWCNIFEN